MKAEIDYALILLQDGEIAAQARSSASELLLNENDVDFDGDFSVNPLPPAIDYLEQISIGHESIFRSVTGLKFDEFEELCRIIVPHIIHNARSTGEQRLKEGRKPKLSHLKKVRPLVFVLF